MRDQSPAPCGSPGSAFRHDSMTRIMSDGVPPGTTGAGENIAWTCGPRGRLFGTNWSYSAMPAHCRASLDYTSALLQFCQWINSSGHRQAIENSSYRWIGVGSSEKSASGQTSVFSTTRFSNAPAPTPEPTPTASNLTCRNEPVTVDLSLGQEPTEGDDVIVGTSSADVIDGKGGNDLICGLGGGDTIYGGPGNDRIYSQRGRDIVYGGSGDDVIFGGGRDDEIHGGTGNDLMFGGGGSDTMYGGDGIDVVKGNKDSDRLFGDGGDDTLRGNAGDDTLDGGPDDDVLRGGLGSDACDGTEGADKTVSCETLTRLP